MFAENFVICYQRNHSLGSAGWRCGCLPVVGFAGNVASYSQPARRCPRTCMASTGNVLSMRHFSTHSVHRLPFYNVLKTNQRSWWLKIVVDKMTWIVMYLVKCHLRQKTRQVLCFVMSGVCLALTLPEEHSQHCWTKWKKSKRTFVTYNQFCTLIWQ